MLESNRPGIIRLTGIVGWLIICNYYQPPAFDKLFLSFIPKKTHWKSACIYVLLCVRWSNSDFTRFWKLCLSYYRWTYTTHKYVIVPVPIYRGIYFRIQIPHEYWMPHYATSGFVRNDISLILLLLTQPLKYVAIYSYFSLQLPCALARGLMHHCMQFGL